MRFAAPLAGLALIGLAPAAQAQVTINLHALDALPQAAEPQHRTEPRPARIPRRPAPAPATSAAALAQPPPPTVPAAPPPAAPPAEMAANPPAPAEAPPPASAPLPASAPPAASESAPATASRSISIGFEPNQTSLAPAASESISKLVKAVPRTGSTTFEIAAYAPAIGGDASAARRNSLARAMSVRSALVAAGVPASAVLMRALGAPPKPEAGEADRATITVMGAGQGASVASAAAQQGKSP